MSAKRSSKLVIQFKGHELELLRQAALAENGDADDLAAWAKKTLLKSARDQAPEGQSGRAAKAPSSRPKCSCGATRSPNGECDESCITQF